MKCDPNIPLEDMSLSLFCSEMHKIRPFLHGASGENRQLTLLGSSLLVDFLCCVGAPGGPAAWHLPWVMWLATVNTTAVITTREGGK